MEENVFLEGSVKDIEILEFKSGGFAFGINVALIKEILNYTKPTPVPNAHPYIEGLIMPRDFIITVINVIQCLNLEDVDQDKRDMLVVTNINNKNIALHVDGVSGIHRISQEDINKPDDEADISHRLTMGYILKDDKRIEVLDVFTMINEINPEVHVNG